MYIGGFCAYHGSGSFGNFGRGYICQAGRVERDREGWKMGVMGGLGG